MNRVSFLLNITPLIFLEHLWQTGARYCSKQYSQYSPLSSSTKPMSCNGRLHFSFVHTKCSGHQILPRAVINGPLRSDKRTRVNLSEYNNTRVEIACKKIIIKKRSIKQKNKKQTNLAIWVRQQLHSGLRTVFVAGVLPFLQSSKSSTAFSSPY